MSFSAESPAQRHAFYEDAMAILLATLFMAVGVAFYSKARLAMGGTVGIGLLLQYATGLGFWSTFSLVNVPFYALALVRMGWRFTLRTAVSVSLVAAYSAFMPHWLPLGDINQVFATIMGGAMMGMGLLMLFRHRTALGGTNILAMYLNDRFGWRIPYIQFAIDAITLASSTLFIPFWNVMLSLVGAGIVNLIIAINHKPGRYMGMT